MKKLVVKFMCLLLVAIMIGGTVLAGCSDRSNAPKVDTSTDTQEPIELIQVGVKIIGPDEENILDTIVVGKFDTANEVFNESFNQNSILNDGLSDGFITAINGIENTDTEGWLFFVDGEAASVGINDAKVKNDTQISLEWTVFE